MTDGTNQGGDTGFWAHHSVEELAAEQDVTPVYDLAELAASDLTDDEVDAFLTAIRGGT